MWSIDRSYWGHDTLVDVSGLLGFGFKSFVLLTVRHALVLFWEPKLSLTTREKSGRLVTLSLHQWTRAEGCALSYVGVTKDIMRRVRSGLQTTSSRELDPEQLIGLQQVMAENRFVGMSFC